MKKVKEIQAELLNTFIDICNKFNLRWTLAYGTLLGAIRDGGFISWDHDVDVFMPISDYRKLYALNKTKKLFPENIALADYDSFNKGMRNFKLIRKNTTLATKDHILGHLFLDIYPVFNINDSPDSIEMISKLATEFKSDYYNLCTSILNKDISKYTIDFEDAIDKLPSSNQGNTKSMDLEDMVGYSYKNLTVSDERVKKYIIDKIDFNNPEIVYFPDLECKVNIPRNPTYYLKKWYGDYEIPRKEGAEFIIDTETDCDYYIKTKTIPATKNPK